MTATSSTIAIRPARPADDMDLEVLAALDSSLPLTGEILVATVDGEPQAAIQLSDGRAIADPFVPSAELVALLRVRARAVAGVGGSVSPRQHRFPSAPVSRLALAP